MERGKEVIFAGEAKQSHLDSTINLHRFPYLQSILYLIQLNLTGRVHEFRAMAKRDLRSMRPRREEEDSRVRQCRPDCWLMGEGVRNGGAGR